MEDHVPVHMFAAAQTTSSSLGLQGDGKVQSYFYSLVCPGTDEMQHQQKRKTYVQEELGYTFQDKTHLWKEVRVIDVYHVCWLTCCHAICSCRQMQTGVRNIECMSLVTLCLWCASQVG